MDCIIYQQEDYGDLNTDYNTINTNWNIFSIYVT